jgi:hypothetical protein
MTEVCNGTSTTYHDQELNAADHLHVEQEESAYGRGSSPDDNVSTAAGADESTNEPTVFALDHIQERMSDFREPLVIIDRLAFEVGRNTPSSDGSRWGHAHDRKAVRLGSEAEGGIMSGHDQLHTKALFPEKRTREVNRIEGAEFRRHRLRRAVENQGIDFHQFERRDQLQDRGATTRHFHIRKVSAQAEAIQRAETLGRNQSTRDALLDVSPLG